MIARPSVIIASFYDDLATREELTRKFEEGKDGTCEIMCHPGYVDDAFAKESSYTKQLETELEVLTDPSIKLAIQASNIDLITFAEL